MPGENIYNKETDLEDNNNKVDSQSFDPDAKADFSESNSEKNDGFDPDAPASFDEFNPTPSLDDNFDPDAKADFSESFDVSQPQDLSGDGVYDSEDFVSEKDGNKESEGQIKENAVAEENEPKETPEDKLYTSYKERYDQTPSDKNDERGTWEGERGESKFIPNDNDKNKEMNDYLNEKGVDGINYENGVVDFSPVAEETVEISDMTEYRGDNHGPRPDGKPGNFEQAYEAVAQKWNNEQKDGRTDWTARDIKDWAKDPSQHGGYILVVHERSDGKTCDFVRKDVHDFFGHTGGCSECKHRDAQNERWSDYNTSQKDGEFDE